MPAAGCGEDGEGMGGGEGGAGDAHPRVTGDLFQLVAV